MYRIGLIGLPNAGKSTIFNLLTGSHVLVADYAFSTVEPNKANFRSYDKNLQKLQAGLKSANTLVTEIELWDIAGLVEGASSGMGLGNEFLGYIKDCDLLLHIVSNSGDLKDLEISIQTVDKETALFDHKLLLKPTEKARRMTKLYPKEKDYKEVSEALSKAYSATINGNLVSSNLTKDQLNLVTDIGLISSKPTIYIINETNVCSQVSSSFPKCLKINALDCLSLEDLDSDEARMLGYDKAVVSDFIMQLTEEIIAALSCKRFYTVGHLGIGMWIISNSAHALNCAQLIHTDLSDTLKSVRVASVEDFVAHKSWTELAKQGLVKKYGPSYVPKDGSVLYFDM